MSPVILSKFKQFNKRLFPLKSSKNHMFSDDFRGNISLNSFEIGSEIWR